MTTYRCTYFNIMTIFLEASSFEDAEQQLTEKLNIVAADGWYTPDGEEFTIVELIDRCPDQQ